MSYTDKLAEMGIVASRINAIDKAMESLHSALCALDNSQLKIFGSQFGLIGHLDTYARNTQAARNVAVEMYNNSLRKAAKNIDHDDFPNLRDKLLCLAEEAAELKIPGASMLCKSLIDISKNYTLPRMLFSALAIQAENIAQVHGVINRDSLEIRFTHKFKDAYRYMDESQRIGTVETLRGVDRKQDLERGEDGTRLLFVRVTLDEDLEFPVDYQTVKDALYHHYTEHGCRHDHDCCGCISQTVSRIKLLRVNNFGDTQIYAISVSWSKNV